MSIELFLSSYYPVGGFYIIFPKVEKTRAYVEHRGVDLRIYVYREYWALHCVVRMRCTRVLVKPPSVSKVKEEEEETEVRGLVGDGGKKAMYISFVSSRCTTRH